MKKKQVKIILIIIGLLGILFIGYHLYLEYQTDIKLFFDPKTSREELMTTIRSHGFYAAFILIFMIALMCAMPGVPTSVIGVIVGLSYGPMIGGLINILGNAFGNILSITLMKHLKLFNHKNKSNRWVKAISEMKHPKIGVMVGYMIPVIPSSIVDFAVITLHLKTRDILISIFLGVIPSSLLYAGGGEALFHGYNKTAFLLVASVLLFSALVMVISKDRRKHQRNRDRR